MPHRRMKRQKTQKSGTCVVPLFFHIRESSALPSDGKGTPFLPRPPVIFRAVFFLPNAVRASGVPRPVPAEGRVREAAEFRGGERLRPAAALYPRRRKDTRRVLSLDAEGGLQIVGDRLAAHGEQAAHHLGIRAAFRRHAHARTKLHDRGIHLRRGQEAAPPTGNSTSAPP